MASIDSASKIFITNWLFISKNWCRFDRRWLKWNFLGSEFVKWQIIFFPFINIHKNWHKIFPMLTWSWSFFLGFWTSRNSRYSFSLKLNLNYLNLWFWKSFIRKILIMTWFFFSDFMISLHHFFLLLKKLRKLVLLIKIVFNIQLNMIPYGFILKFCFLESYLKIWLQKIFPKIFLAEL